MDSLNLMNKFLHEEHFCTFLLNKDDKIVVIGNPVLNSKVKEIYLNVISGEVMPSSNINQPLTIASLSKDSVDIEMCIRDSYESGSFYIFDRGYVDFSRLYRIDQSEAWFVILGYNDECC